jgi:hypothetical protein
MKIIGFIIIFSLLLGKEPKPLDQFVVDYLLLTQSKMADSPMVWQDVREGYLRNEAIYFSEIILDSLADGLTSYHVVKTHLPKINQLREQVREGKDFDYNIKKPPPSMANVNYFSSIKD